MDSKFIDDLARKLSAGLPAGLRGLQEDLESNFRAVLRSTLGKLDLVTREEFEVQSAVLARTRERLKAFEERIATLEGVAAPAPAKKAAKAASGKRSKKRSTSKSKAGKKSGAGKTGRKKD